MAGTRSYVAYKRCRSHAEAIWTSKRQKNTVIDDDDDDDDNDGDGGGSGGGGGGDGDDDDDDNDDTIVTLL